MRYFAMSVAAVALAASGGLSAQNNGNGKGKNGDRGGPPAAAAKAKGSGAKPDRGPAKAQGQERRGNGQAQARQQNRGNADRGPAASRGNGNGNDRAGQGRIERGNGKGKSAIGGNGNRRDYDDRDRRGGIIDTVLNGPDYRYGRSGQGLIQGCPPGLAKKRNGCNPPGQVREQRSLFGSRYRPSLFGFSNYGDGRYFYDDGYLMRLGNNGGIAGWLPLLGGALGIGSVWPETYRSYRAPDYYVDYYGLGGRDNYRYADNVIYRVDPETAAIQSVAALLTGDEFVVGQPAPRGYDVYNVPYSYRDRYYDRPDAYYRYSDGYVYQIDPETQLVAAAIDLLI